ncbi:hypothetical protein E4K67_17260 [Desulfosporosinus fructosivorans]|uniref:Uncharacterized protein n=1 Tax=Desulfosporosinus fructosivorans TaxID=2018669 RepID=A0A4Z0R2Y1_9FIRM|nr:hypothetical protein [Desulfosporosinus fructosivorans]TGE36849.1 hypothetical protein E4K67_17260 [Desulfosporosinus fructosivorans]
MNKDELKFQTVKSHKHGILKKSLDLQTDRHGWVFKGPNEINDYVDEFELIEILDDLSKLGYELICSISNSEFILRTKNEIEEIEEYQDIDPENFLEIAA